MAVTCFANAPVAAQLRCSRRQPILRSGLTRPIACQATRSKTELEAAVTKLATWGTATGTLLAAGQVQAASELTQAAATVNDAAAKVGDNRTAFLLALLLPALGWVTYNIAGPAGAQYQNMRVRSATIGLGLAAAGLVAAQQAEASEIAQLADKGGDSRILIIAAIFLPVVGWVGFNIIGPALNQLNNMQGGGKPKASGGRKRAVAAGLGLSAASLLATQTADAATEIAELADKAGDARLGIIAAIFLPVVAWVGFNILGPATNQLENMKLKK